MASTDLPFAPVRGALYSSRELMQGFDPDDPRSAAETLDFRIYRYYTVEGSNFPTDPVAGMMEALADNSIAHAMFAYTHKQPKVAAIMGGHSLLRGEQTYRDVVSIAKQLAEAGFIVATGGGPGAMEAAHLGALYRGRSDGDVAKAVDDLAAVAELPDTVNVVGKVGRTKGKINWDMVEALHKWALPAWRIQQEMKHPGESLAVPTWYYGHEPLTPLATHVAKFFQNSIREDTLLMLAAQGIVYTDGRAGTIQEVFQDAAQNYYAERANQVCPMVFYANDDFWTHTLPVEKILKPLFGFSRWKDMYDKVVTVVHRPEDAAAFIIDKAVPTAQRTKRAESMGMSPMLLAAAR